LLKFFSQIPLWSDVLVHPFKAIFHFVIGCQTTICSFFFLQLFLIMGPHGGVVVSTVASQREGSRFNSRLVLSVWSLHVLPVYAWVLSRYSSFLPPSKNMHVRLTGDSKLSFGVSVSVCGCLSRLSLCCPVMDWRPVQGVPHLSPNDLWDRLQPPATRPTD